MKKYALFAQNPNDPNSGLQGSLLFFADISKLREQLIHLNETYDADANEDDINYFCNNLGISYINEESLEKLQNIFGTYCQILYFGKTQDLATSENELAGVIRAEFRGEIEDPSPQYTEPVSRTDLKEFMEFLENWKVGEED